MLLFIKKEGFLIDFGKICFMIFLGVKKNKFFYFYIVLEVLKGFVCSKYSDIYFLGIVLKKIGLF